jgi:TonB family protein
MLSGIRFASPIIMLALDPLAPCTPRLPERRLGGLTQFTASAAMHVVLMALAAVTVTVRSAPVLEDRHADRSVDAEVRRIVFIAPATPRTGGGGGGGGNRQPAPIRRAQAHGSDRITLRVQQAPPLPPPPEVIASPAPEDVAPLPSIVLEAKSLASGLFDQIGLPSGGVLSSASTGPGSGGGVGSGRGTGIGSGDGPGLGPGSGGGAGGGVYRPGGPVSVPRLIKNVNPKYTSDALLKHIEGTVVLEAIVTADGCASQIRVVRSLDRGGLDEEAVTAVAQWRFAPGRLAGAPVDVLVTILVDFAIR